LNALGISVARVALGYQQHLFAAPRLGPPRSAEPRGILAGGTPAWRPALASCRAGACGSLRVELLR